jgi:peptidoglycan/xylan/chitin deacetylase (PgdA/CDA1 family)
MYLVKTPWIVKRLYSSLIWDIKTEDKKLYLTFDDGPHPKASSFVLDTLKQYNAKATFFCIGKNVIENRDIYNRIISEGHTVGNHTQNHLNGWKTNDEDYITNIKQAALNIDSKLFRPPYGRISRFQIKLLQQLDYRIVMWDVLSGDFDTTLSKEKCANNVILQAISGSIIVFHDSEKAWERLEYALPKVLEYFNGQGFEFECLH